MRQLRYFVTVADEGSISRAAQCLHISQPPLTRQIQQLEQQVGAPLFERTPKGVQLTNAGRYLLEDARVILNLADQAAERAQLAAQG
ncbi:MAG: LysR family transcriptional regulator, partial [Burkholderiaceae bacterium]